MNKKSRETSFEDPRFEDNEDEDTAAQRDFVMGEVRFAGYGMTDMSGCCLVGQSMLFSLVQAFHPPLSTGVLSSCFNTIPNSSQFFSFCIHQLT